MLSTRRLFAVAMALAALCVLVPAVVVLTSGPLHNAALGVCLASSVWGILALAISVSRI